MLSRGQTVNEWPHLAAVFLLDHANVTDQARQDLAAVKPVPTPPQKVPTQESLAPNETVVKPAVKVPPSEPATPHPAPSPTSSLSFPPYSGSSIRPPISPAASDSGDHSAAGRGCPICTPSPLSLPVCSPRSSTPLPPRQAGSKRRWSPLPPAR